MEGLYVRLMLYSSSLPLGLSSNRPPTPLLCGFLCLYQDFLYFSTLLFPRCFANNYSHGFLPAYVAAAVLKQVLVAIGSVCCQMVSAPLCESV